MPDGAAVYRLVDALANVTAMPGGLAWQLAVSAGRSAAIAALRSLSELPARDREPASFSTPWMYSRSSSIVPVGAALACSPRGSPASDGSVVHPALAARPADNMTTRLRMSG